MTSASPDPQPADFPAAAVRERATAAGVLASKLWWLTLICVGVAGILAWRAIPVVGPQISIQFPQGHGLKAGDAVRFRGIDVGHVTEVSLTDSLDGVLAQVELRPSAAVMCRQNTRFWIVRPRLDLTGIQGLETAVGAKYIAVNPGSADGDYRSEFEGLPTAPPDELDDSGLELLLRSDARHGLSPGAPVTWRGVTVGQVLSVGLSADARHVDAVIRVQAKYRRLVAAHSKFWVTSGLGVHVGLDGVDLSAESLATLALGGVSFITPASENGNSHPPVRPGQVFDLHPTEDPDWTRQAAAVSLVDVDLASTVSLAGSHRSSFWGIPRTVEFTATGLIIEQQGRAAHLLTAGLPVTNAGDQETHTVDLTLHSSDADQETPVPAVRLPSDVLPLQILPLPADLHNLPTVAASRLRIPDSPEECAVTRTVSNSNTTAPLCRILGRHEFTDTAGGWQIQTEPETDFSPWSGAPVQSLSDGKIIGVLVAAEQGTLVIPLTESALAHL